MRTSIRSAVVAAISMLTMIVADTAVAQVTFSSTRPLHERHDIQYVGVAAAMFLMIGLVGLIAQYVWSDEAPEKRGPARPEVPDEISSALNRILGILQDDETTVVLLRTRRTIEGVGVISQYDEDLRRDIAAIRRRFSTVLMEHGRIAAGLPRPHALVLEERLRSLATRLTERLAAMTDEQSGRDLARMQRHAERIGSEAKA